MLAAAGLEYRERVRLRAAILRGRDDKRYAYGWAKLIGKVGKALGPEAAHDTKPVVVSFYTNLNPLALAGPNSPAGDASDLPVQAGERLRPATPERPIG